MKLSQSIVFAILVVWQVSAHAESTNKHEHQEEEHSAHSEKAEDDHKHDDEGHEGHDEDKHEEHGSHEHGAAHMTIAVGGNGLEIQLKTPAANILGFEHEASSAEDKKALKVQKAKLQNSKALFHVNEEANCVPASTKIESSLFEEHDDHAVEKHSEETHNDIDVNWTFNCKASKAIKNVSVNLFSMFPKGFEHIKIDWISDTSASTVSLKKDGMINFK